MHVSNSFLCALGHVCTIDVSNTWVREGFQWFKEEDDYRKELVENGLAKPNISLV